MENPLVSVVITTKNEEKNIGRCIRSIKKQSYPQDLIEIIVVDNKSTDKTVKIAKKYTDLVFDKGPERSAQRNFGVSQSKGDWFIFLDADMILSKEVIEACVSKIQKNPKLVGLYISEIVMGKSFFSKVRRFERKFYDATVIDGVRFIKKENFIEIGGFDENMYACEDWDLDKRLKTLGEFDLVKNPIFHNEKELKISKYLKKKSYYVKNFDVYIEKWGKEDEDVKKQLGFSYRFFGVFVEKGKWKKILKNPILFFALLVLKVLIGLKFVLAFRKKPMLEKKQRDILVIKHSSEIEGPIDYYIKYLISKGHKIISIDHPLDNYKNRQTIIKKHSNTILKLKRYKIFGIFNLFLDFFLSLFFTLTNKSSLFIGANNFDVLPAIFIKLVFRNLKIKKIIYFASDFSEERFKSKLLNEVYYIVEKIALRYSDLVVSNTKRAAHKRFSMGLIATKSVVVPNGALLEKLSFDDKKISKRKFIFVGSVTKEHGLHDLIDEIYSIISELVLIGRGEDWERVLNLCREKNIKVEAYYKKKNAFVMNFMQGFNGLGLAPYNLFSKWTYYCSPLKVSEYIACGIPVLMSSVPEIAETVKEKRLGVVYKSINVKEIEGEINSFNEKNFHKKAKLFYDAYNRDTLYSSINLN